VRSTSHGQLVLRAADGKGVGHDAPGVASSAALARRRLGGGVRVGPADLEPVFAVPALILVGRHVRSAKEMVMLHRLLYRCVSAAHSPASDLSDH
jgi:hypothetical protein